MKKSKGHERAPEKAACKQSRQLSRESKGLGLEREVAETRDGPKTHKTFNEPLKKPFGKKKEE
jgi:hypothetical protein